MGSKRLPARSIDITTSVDGLRATFFAMGSPCELLTEAGDEREHRVLAAAVAAEAWRIEDKFSRYREGNVVDRINSSNGAAVSVDAETARLIEFSVQLHELSEGRFDITSGVLRRAWTFDGSNRLPAVETVEEYLQHVGWHRVTWQDGALQMPAGMEIDFGGVGKEYAVDRAAAIARAATDAPCLINFGGDLVATGAPGLRPAWQVGIESLQGDEGPERVISLVSGALATSGDARRYLRKDGVRFGHILDPTTGWPVVDAPRSVTVAADTCVQAGMLSTLAMLKGAEAEAFLQAQAVDFWCLREPGTA